MLKGDPNLERTMIVHNGREKMFALYCKLYNKKASTVQNTLGKLLQRNKTFQFSVFLLFQITVY